VNTTTPAYIPSTYCGDGIVQKNVGEVCDAGQLNGSIDSNCSTTCQIKFVSTCGNGMKQDKEECDDGNTRNGDGCNYLCNSEIGRCGDGKVQSALNEQCDDGNRDPNDDCDNRCWWTQLAECGDGIIDAGLEQCDEGTGNASVENGLCNDNCTYLRCGDDILSNFFEECDDGNNVDGDGCNALCIRELAGAPPITADLVSPPLAQDDELIFEQIPTPAKTETGPGLVIFLASGAAAGIGLARRRIRKAS